MGIRCADHVTPLYPQKLALTSPTGGGRSVGIVRLRTKATEFVFFIFVRILTLTEMYYSVIEARSLAYERGGYTLVIAPKHNAS